MHSLGASARRPWTTREITTLREHYPTGAINGVIEQLPHRSRAAVYNYANKLGLRFAGMVSVRESWAHDTALDESIRIAHQRPMKRGDVERLAKRIGRPVWWTSRRARDLGLTTPRFRDPDWSAVELAILKRTAHLCPASVQKALKKESFQRTTTAIAVQRTRRGITRQPGDDYSCRQAAELLGADDTTLLREVRKGYLKAKPHPDHKARSDGRQTQYVITERDLREYIISHPVRLNLRKLPAGHVPWFIDLVAGRANLSV